MPLDRSNFNLFGFDLYRLYEEARQGLADVARWPLFQCLLPVDPLRVHQPDGRVVIMLPSGRRVAEEVSPEPPGAAGSLSAVLLPDEEVLAASLRLPADASRDDCVRAAMLAIQADSPFPADDTASGLRIETAGEGAVGPVVHYAIASRRRLAQRWKAQRHPADAEAWAWVAGAPVVLTGYGEHLRQRSRRRYLLKVGALVVLLASLLLVLAAVPVLHSRQRAIDAHADYQGLAERTAPVAAAREALGRANARIESLQQHIDVLPDPSWLLVTLTDLLPDSVHLTQLDTRGVEATIRGTADNAGALIELLGTAPGISEVRPASAIVRNPASGRETFVIQLRYHTADTEGGRAQ
ncbi:PilN domain-containing protein [Thauera sp. ZXT1-4]|uniref:PilN domain-containing protein n=1 Tax=Thauera sp. ZXT1-4 TaxID=3460294 RepID=UPI00404092ED